MPIEIKELHIKINVSEEGAEKPQSDGSGKTDVIQECMDQVMTMLKNKDER
ncbi:MAG: DUF5908 family protein [Crocinitomicaceae bacterium]